MVEIPYRPIGFGSIILVMNGEKGADDQRCTSGSFLARGKLG